MNKKTSQEWHNEIYRRKVEIHDPDGWDRSNFNYNWYEEEITRDEFINRLAMSTVQIKDANIFKRK